MKVIYLGMEDVNLGSSYFQIPEHGLKRFHGFTRNFPFEDLGGDLPGLLLFEDILVFMNKPDRVPRNQVLMKSEEMGV